MTSAIEGLEAVKAFLDEFPERVQRRVCRHAVKKASTAVAGRARALTPRQRRMDGRRGWHTQDKVAVKPFNRKTVSMAIIGVQSGFGRLSHLFERGSADRFHNMHTRLATVVVGKRTVNRRVKLANGGYRTVKETIDLTKRQGTGSRPKVGGRGKYVGRMPASHPLARASAEMLGIANQIMETEIRAGLNRVIAKSGSSE